MSTNTLQTSKYRGNWDFHGTWIGDPGRKWKPRGLKAEKCATCVGMFIRTRGREQKRCLKCLSFDERRQIKA